MTSYSYQDEGGLKAIWENLFGIMKFLSVFAIGVSLFSMISLFSSEEDHLEDYKPQSSLIRDFNPRFGNEQSEVEVVIVEDFLCNHCADYFKTLKPIKENYQDEALFVYKNVYNKYSLEINRAAQAASYQGKYLEYAELAFENQDDFYAEGVSALKDWADQIEGLDFAKWNEDRQSEQVAEQVAFDMEDIMNDSWPKTEDSMESKNSGDGIGTPTTLVYKNGELVNWWSGAYDGQTVAERIEEVVN